MARDAMIALGASPEVLSLYRELRKEDLRVNTAIADPNARGRRQEAISWIFNVATGKSNTNLRSK